jgi:D-glycero-D-manno-heptose 1,7-bisphosphate phosphatase
MNRAVFLDRDGVITRDPPHYAHRLDQLSLITGSAKAIQMLNANNFHIIVITNQSGVARGYYTEEDVKIYNDGMESLLAKEGARIDAIFYCPHHPEAKVERYRIDCDCRKPKPGMLIAGGKKYTVDFTSSFLVGDKWSDIEAGRSMGCTSVLVRTGHGEQEYASKKGPVDFVASDLLDAVENFILAGKR